MSILTEIQEKLHTRATDLYKLASLANGASDDDWKSLSVDAQEWVNSVMEEKERAEIEGRKPKFPPADGDGPAPAAEEAADEGNDDAETELSEAGEPEDEPADEPEDTSVAEADAVQEEQDKTEAQPEEAESTSVKKRKTAKAPAEKKGGRRPLSEEAKARMAAGQAARRARERGEAPAEPVGTAVADAKVVRAKAVRAPRPVAQKRQASKPAAIVSAGGLSSGAVRYELVDNKDGTYKIERIRSQAVGVFFDKQEAETYFAVLQRQ